MTSRNEVNKLAEANREIVQKARVDLRKFFDRLPADPDLAIGMLREFYPVLVEMYGDAAALVASDWYQRVRQGELAEDFEAVLGSNPDADMVRSSIQHAAKFLDRGEPDKAFNALSGSMQRLVSHSSRQTVIANVEADKAQPRFARVPRGSFTCAFCLMMASRGFVYHSKETAGITEKFHNDCDCQIVPGWGKNPKVRGYDPDVYLEMYEAAQKQAASSDTKSVLAKMREIYPNEISDGIRVVRGGHIPRDWEKNRRPIANFGGTTRLPGKFSNPDGAWLEKHELETALTLVKHGLDIEWQLESEAVNVKNPDFLMGGQFWDAKSPKGGGKNTISNQFKRGKTQASNLVFDLRRTTLYEPDAIAEINRRFPYQGTLSELIIIKQDGSIERLSK